MGHRERYVLESSWGLWVKGQVFGVQGGLAGVPGKASLQALPQAARLRFVLQLCAARGATRRQEMPPCHRPGSHHLGRPQKGLPRGRAARGACCSCVLGDFWQAWAKAAWVPPVLAWMKVGAPAHFLQEPHVHCLFSCGVGQSQPSPHCVGLAS